MNIEQRQALFLEMMEEISKDQPINEAVEYFDEAVAIYEAVEEFFVENFRALTIEEQVVAVVRGIEVNEDLYDVLAGAMLEESIGTAIATVVHGIGQRRAEKKAAAAEKDYQKKSEVAHQAGSLAAKRTLATKQADKSNKGTVVGTFKAAYARARSDKQYNKYLAAKKAKADADVASQTAQKGAEAKQQKRADLASKIDTGVAKAKEAVKSGMKKAAGFLGRKIGSLA